MDDEPERASRWSTLFRRMARALDQSAALAEQHAQRHVKSGDATEAAREREVAMRASAAAKQADQRADEAAGLDSRG